MVSLDFTSRVELYSRARQGTLLAVTANSVGTVLSYAEGRSWKFVRDQWRITLA